MQRDNGRARAGTLVSAAGIVLNILLAAAKITAGAIFGMVSVIADGINNFTDCGSSAVSLASFRIAEKPADKEHPYGHRRAEYIASMVIGFIVLFVAIELFRESVTKIVEGTVWAAEWWVFLVLGLSIAVKACMFVFYRAAAKRLQSDALRAAATDSACDCLATLAVIAGGLISKYAGFPADGWAGAAVALFILWQGIMILKDAVSELLGHAPDPALKEDIRRHLLEGEGVLGVHDMRMYGYGRGAYFATAHVEMDCSVPSLEAHAVLDGLEHSVAEKFGVELTVHLDPVDLKDSEARALECAVRSAVGNMGEGLQVHDFRLVRGAANKLIFDIGAPYSCKLTDGEIRLKVENALSSLGDFTAVITVERE